MANCRSMNFASRRFGRFENFLSVRTENFRQKRRTDDADSRSNECVRLILLTILTIYDNLDRVEIHNELMRTNCRSWAAITTGTILIISLSRSTFPKNNLKIKRGGQKWFDTLPDDYLPGARTDAVTTQHLIGMTDGNSSAHARSPAGISLGLSELCRHENSAERCAERISGNVHRQIPSARSDHLFTRRAPRNQADTHDVGVINMLTVEPGLEGKYVFDYAVAGGRKVSTR